MPVTKIERVNNALQWRKENSREFSARAMTIVGISDRQSSYNHWSVNMSNYTKCMLTTIFLVLNALFVRGQFGKLKYCVSKSFALVDPSLKFKKRKIINNNYFDF